MKLVLPGRVPSKKNQKRIVCRGNRPLLLSSENYEAWHEEMMLRVRRFRPKKPFETAVITVRIFPPDRIKGDLSNKEESVFDLLVDAGFLKDDNWFVLGEKHTYFGGVDRKNPRVELEINERPNA